MNSLGGITKYLSIDENRPTSIEYKATAVVNNFEGAIDLSRSRRGWEYSIPGFIASHPIQKPSGSRAVWIDDQAAEEEIQSADSERARHILNVPAIKIMRPIGTIGLTMMQLDEVEHFLLRSDSDS